MSKQLPTTYLKLCTEFYDLELEQHHDAALILAFYMDYALQTNGPILEPMCGTGRFLIPMLQVGLDIEGFDASEHMLEALKQKYAHISHKPAPVWQQFIQDLQSNKQYQLIFIPFGSWGLITDLESSKQCLEKMYHHLKNGGKFVVEIETIGSVPQDNGSWKRGIHTRKDGSRIALNMLSTYEPSTQIFSSICRYESLVENTIITAETENFSQYHYAFNEMDQLLKDVGFAHVKKYQDYAKTVVCNQNSPIIIYECTK